MNQRSTVAVSPTQERRPGGSIVRERDIGARGEARSRRRIIRAMSSEVRRRRLARRRGPIAPRSTARSHRKCATDEPAANGRRSRRPVSGVDDGHRTGTSDQAASAAAITSVNDLTSSDDGRICSLSRATAHDARAMRRARTCSAASSPGLAESPIRSRRARASACAPAAFTEHQSAAARALASVERELAGTIRRCPTLNLCQGSSLLSPRLASAAGLDSTRASSVVHRNPVPLAMATVVSFGPTSTFSLAATYRRTHTGVTIHSSAPGVSPPPSELSNRPAASQDSSLWLTQGCTRPEPKKVLSRDVRGSFTTRRVPSLRSNQPLPGGRTSRAVTAAPGAGPLAYGVTSSRTSPSAAITRHGSWLARDECAAARVSELDDGGLGPAADASPGLTRSERAPWQAASNQIGANGCSQRRFARIALGPRSRRDTRSPRDRWEAGRDWIALDLRKYLGSDVLGGQLAFHLMELAVGLVEPIR
jgi:hypothetical protein